MFDAKANAPGRPNDMPSLSSDLRFDAFDDKPEEANGEENRDGANDNRSWNCGVEGPSDDPGVERLRNRQVKNYLTATLLSLKVQRSRFDVCALPPSFRAPLRSVVIGRQP